MLRRRTVLAHTLLVAWLLLAAGCAATPTPAESSPTSARATLTASPTVTPTLPPATTTRPPSPTTKPTDTAVPATATPAASLPLRRLAAIADAGQFGLLLFGGNGGPPLGILDDTWLWDGANWTSQALTLTPLARSAAGIAYDPDSQTVVLFGGVDIQGNFLGDTCLWNGSGWSEPKLSRSPSARAEPALVYDAQHHVVLLFGGEAPMPGNLNGHVTTTLNDIWAWNGKVWTQLTPPISPSPRTQASLAYDAARQNVVLFGGSPVADVWIWDGQTWREQHPALLPPARSQAAMAYDANHQQLVLFGGYSGITSLRDTWVWTGTAWSQRSPAAPTVAHESSLVYSTTLRELLLFDTSLSRQPVAKWDGAAWATYP